MTAPKKNALEWAVFGISAALVAAVVGYLAYGAVTLGDAPADLHVSLGDTVVQGGRYLVPVTVRNDGNAIAEAVQVEVVLTQPDGEERSQFQIAYVPRRTTREGMVAFTSDPSAGRLAARISGYETP